MNGIGEAVGTVGVVLGLGVAFGSPFSLNAQDANATPVVEVCDTEAHRAFDFWLGTWDVKPMTAPAEQPPRAVNVIDRIQGGCVVKEEYETQSGYTGESFNLYDRSRGVWHQSWVDNGGALLVLEGNLVDGAMVLEGETVNAAGETVLNRVTWNRIDGDPDRVRQHWEVSSDGGESWTTSFDGLYTRRAG